MLRGTLTTRFMSGLIMVEVKGKWERGRDGGRFEGRRENTGLAHGLYHIWADRRRQASFAFSNINQFTIE